MGYTLSVQNGSQCNRSHNIRSKKTVSKESHIDPEGNYEIWHDEKVRDAYERLFGIPMENYNRSQPRQDRQIKSYYNQVEKSPKQHTAYELIVTVGNRDSKPNDEIGRQILKKFCDTWKERNPSLELVGAYYHADEKDPETGQPSAPHVHIDYIPVASGYKTGMETRTGLNRAFRTLGFEKKGKLTPQMQWQERERRTLEDICQEFGVEYEPEKKSARRHFSKETYIAHQKLREKQKEVDQKQREAEGLDRTIDEKNGQLAVITRELQRQQEEKEKKQRQLEKMEALAAAYNEAQNVPVRKALFSGDRADISVEAVKSLQTANVRLKSENRGLMEENRALSDKLAATAAKATAAHEELDVQETLAAWHQDYRGIVRQTLSDNPELSRQIDQAISEKKEAERENKGKNHDQEHNVNNPDP